MKSAIIAEERPINNDEKYFFHVNKWMFFMLIISYLLANGNDFLSNNKFLRMDI